MKFLDQVKIYIKAGNGGDGSPSFRREKFIDYSDYVFDGEKYSYDYPFEKINGLIIGELENMKDQEIEFGRNTDQIILDICGDLDIPIISNFPCGHGKYPATLPLSLNAEIDTSNKEAMVTILDSAVDLEA